jgi:hypothetical protein
MTKPVFGVDRDPGVIAANMVVMGRKPGTKHAPVNPMVVALGPGPADKVCGDCRFLVPKGGNTRTYYGCEKRGPFTRGPKTDHLVRWPTCLAFEERPA